MTAAAADATGIPLPESAIFRRAWVPALFFLSGVSGLIYEVIWMRMLIRVFGITLYATSTAVAVFLGGLALGSWLAGRMTAKRPVSLRWYAAVEAAVALSALAATAVMRKLPAAYAALSSGFGGALSRDVSVPGTAIRFLLAASTLLVPTLLMGATLPILSRWMARNDREIGLSLGSLYGVNTLGAVAGVLFSGFVSIARWGEGASVAIGAALNLAVAAAAFVLAAPGTNENTGPTSDRPAAPVADASPRLYLALAAVSGFCALAYQVVWTRFLILFLGSSVYAFSVMLALYLAGIAAGSLVIARWLDRFRRPSLVFAGLQIGVAAAGVLSLHVFRSLGLSMLDRRYLYSPLTGAEDIPRFFFMAAVIIAPVTLLLGMIFPLMGRLVTDRFERAGEAIGRLYAANTVGAVLGVIVTGFGLMTALGAQKTFLAACGINFLMGASILFWKRVRRNVAAACAAALLVTALPLRGDVFLAILRNRLVRFVGAGEVLFHREGKSATVTGYRTIDPIRYFLFINGIEVSGKGLFGSLMADLPLILQERPGRALVICFGAGNTVRSSVLHGVPTDAVELVEDVVRAFPSFYSDADQILSRPGTRVFINDGRNYLLTSRDRYDVIVVDASPPIFSAGTVNLYTREFLDLCRARMSETGLMCLWVPLPCFEEDFWMIARNFKEVFPQVEVWALSRMPGIFLLGSQQPIRPPRAVIARRLAERGLAGRAPWLNAEFLDRGWALTPEEVRAYAARFPTVTDDRPYTEFPLGKFAKGLPFHKNARFLLNARRPADRTRQP